MAELGQEWARLSPAERVAFQLARAAFRQILARPAAQAAATAETPWPFCGDDIYPVSEACLEEVSCAVDSWHKKWVAWVGVDVVQPCAAIEVPP